MVLREDRFKSVIVEDSVAAKTISGYIDPIPVRICRGLWAAGIPVPKSPQRPLILQTATSKKSGA